MVCLFNRRFYFHLLGILFLYLQQVRILIQEALLLYGADKTGRVDYALESVGM